ncbi:MAG: SGNH/GDSL hydrolase family protein [candidate division Zixibacteria bacterium]|nr:SGNH/GDSL hydrolase family protein [candidate division Zixibacteria bacterium]MDH3937652.1 SGNH/GDSL hydrolase family protein [candidate division Zixibacteria bacterium]MDH4032661.1 SGNH/GDSL hydrolase family protein [candidate division Zixibacteria bacterium]
MPTSPKTVSLTVRVLAAFVSVALFLVVIELALALVAPDLYHQNQFFPSNRDIDFPEVYDRDARLMWRFRPGITTTSRLFSDLDYSINSLGMRGPDLPDRSDAYRIIAVGNSCTFGWGVSFADTWVHRLQSLLNEQIPGRTVEIINAGVPGYSSFQGKRYLSDDLIALQPDMVLVMFGHNDHFPAGRSVSDSAQQLSNSLLIESQNLLSKLRLYRLLRKGLLQLTSEKAEARLDDIGSVKRVSRPEFFANLKEIVRMARSFDVQPVLLIPPVASLENYYEGTVSNFHHLHQLYQKEMVRASQYEEAPVVDLQAAFDNHHTLFDDVTNDPIHFNRQGHIVAARTIAEAVAPIIETQ